MPIIMGMGNTGRMAFTSVTRWIAASTQLPNHTPMAAMVGACQAVNLPIDYQPCFEVGAFLEKKSFKLQLIPSLERHGVLDSCVWPGKQSDFRRTTSKPLR